MNDFEAKYLRAVFENLPTCTTCGDAPATNATAGISGLLFYGCDNHRPPEGVDIRYADALRAYEIAMKDPVLTALARLPVGRPMTLGERQHIEDGKAFQAAGGDGCSTDTLLARLSRMRSSDPTVVAEERATHDAEMKDYEKKVVEGRRLLAKGKVHLAREVTRLRGILIECAKNHPESAEWIMAMFTPLDGSFDDKPAPTPAAP